MTTEAPVTYKNPTAEESESQAKPGQDKIGTIPQRYVSTDHRRIFLDTDNLRKWDIGLFQRFYKAEKIPMYGVEPGPVGSWDSRNTEIFGSVLAENGKYRMWYNCEPDVLSYDESEGHAFACYAESNDGIHWNKPNLGITGQNRYPGNNLIPLPGWIGSVVHALPGAGCKYLAVVAINAPLEPDITDQKKWGFKYEIGGTYLFASDDGLHWRQWSERPVVIHGDIMCLYADHSTKRYFLYNKTGLIHGLDMRRSWIGLESPDAIHWEGYNGIETHRECFVTDDYDDLLAVRAGMRQADYYMMAMHRVGDLYVAVESMLYVSDPLGHAFGQNPKGICQFRLAFSHNGFNWRHPKGRPTFMEHGEPGQLDAGYIFPAGGLTEQGDDLLLYYTGYRYAHSWNLDAKFHFDKSIPLSQMRDISRVMVARIKKDRFASLAAPYKACFEVENTTKMELTSGRRHLDAGPRGGDALFVNARCPEGGIRVALIDHAKNAVLPGFSLDDCIPFTGDAVRGQIRFRGKSIAEIPQSMGLQLRFEVTRGEIFGYDWGSADRR